ncbi:hypothetical protein VJJ74_07980, partial [Parvimonas micra]|uniref:hypothetical protein n=1 Tax=Parvimonas micra TaxID=33033 RepID=UPI002B45A2A8
GWITSFLRSTKNDSSIKILSFITVFLVHIFFKIFNFKPKAVRLTKREYQNDSIKEKGAGKTPKTFFYYRKKTFWGCSSVGRAPALQAGGQ